MKSDLQRLYDWLIDDNREPARTKFTSGLLRNVASEIEFKLSQSVNEKKEVITHLTINSKQ